MLSKYLLFKITLLLKFIKIALSKSLLFTLSFKVWVVNFMSKNNLSEECLKMGELTTVIFMQPSNSYQDTSLTPVVIFPSCMHSLFEKLKINASKWEKNKMWSVVLVYLFGGSFGNLSWRFFCTENTNLPSCTEFERCIWQDFIFLLPFPRQLEIKHSDKMQITCLGSVLSQMLTL